MPTMRSSQPTSRSPFVWFIETIQHVLLHPKLFWQQRTPGATIGNAARYMLGILALSALLHMAVGFIGLQYNPPEETAVLAERIARFGMNIEMGLATYSVVVPLLFFFWSFVHALLLLAAARLMRVQTTYQASYQILAYSATAQVIIGALPFVGAIAPLYTFILQMFGIQYWMKVSQWKSIWILFLAVLLPVVLVVGVSVLFALLMAS